ncbi:MAG: hypothetical protein ACFFB0_10910 [Promethearchaeota archaeon]
MPKKYIVFFKTIGRKWFLFLIIIIIIVAIYNPIAAIWMTGITLILFFLSYIPGILFKKKLLKFMNKFFKIEDELIARTLKKPLKRIQEYMFDFSQKQDKKKWLIVFLNKQYIFYHQKTIQAFMDLFKKGYSEKEILDNLTDYKIDIRAEVKAIKDTLIKLKRISEREISVKERYEKQRFKSSL